MLNSYWKVINIHGSYYRGCCGDCYRDYCGACYGACCGDY